MSPCQSSPALIVKLSSVPPILLLYSLLVVLAQSEHRLEVKSAVELAEELDNQNAALWDPQLGASDPTDHRILSQYSLPTFNYDAFSVRKGSFNENFVWSSISLLSLPSYNLSFILLGGSWVRHTNSSFPRENGIVQLCNFTRSSNGLLTPQLPCTDLSDGLKSTAYLGATSASVQIAPNMGLLAYCDPLWRDEGYFPAGRCYLQLVHNTNIRPRHELSSFCRTGGKITEPCMTGFSLDLMPRGRMNTSALDFLRSVHVIVGQPLANGYGRAQILADPFYFPRTFTAYRPEGYKESISGGYFGYSVAGEYISLSGGGYDNAGSGAGVPDQSQLYRVGDLQGIQTAGGVEFDWQSRVDTTGAFTGFGTSMVRLKSSNGQDILVVGAPYAPKSGRVYLYCVPTNLAVESKSRQTVPTYDYNDFVYAPVEAKSFGYALTVLGDIDGDGQDDIAVGAPHLQNSSKSGSVYILRILKNCTFDRRPIQVIEGPESAPFFGSILPRRGSDLDFNGWPDFALPIPYCKSCVPMVFASRPRYQASCRFFQPNWLGSVRIRRNARIPIKLKIRLISSKRGDETSLAELLETARVTVDDLVHQIIPDSWAKATKERRVRLSSFSSVKLNKYYNILAVSFDLLPQMDVEDMPSLEQPDGAIRIHYRFSIPCPNGEKPSKGSKTCSNGAWVHQPRIDWSDCNFQLRLTKYVCLPLGRCESDLTLRAKDEKSDTVVESTRSRAAGESVLIYGDKEGSMTKLTIEVFNKGPTFAGGVWINLAFFGNLRFSALEIAKTDENGGNGTMKFKTKICSHPQNNDTWVACQLGRLEFDEETSSKPSKILRLTTFYDSNGDNVDYTLPSYVNVSVTSQTYDPQGTKNSVVWKFKLRHAPKYLITPGGFAPSSVMDNRTKLANWGTGFHQRILVQEMGPKLHHTFQVEHLGPTARVENVTLRLKVPAKLENKPRPLVYLFNEVRAPKTANGREMEWVSMRPVVKVLGEVNGQSESVPCWYNDEALINQNGFIGIYMTAKGPRRTRRDVTSSSEETTITSEETPLTASRGNISSNGLDEASGRFDVTVTPERVTFRRVPKEVIQCGRMGHKFGQPECVEIICRLKELKQKHPVQISVTGWLYSPTFFHYSTSDIEVVTTLIVDQGAVPRGVMPSPEPLGVLHMPQVFYFTKIQPTLLHQIPIWPVIVGLVLGLLLLAFIIAILYRFGFFRRRRHKLAVSGRRRWRENLDYAAESKAGGADEVDGDLNAFSSMRYAEEARKRRMKLRKHPEEVSILHPDEIPRVEQEKGQDNLSVRFETTPPPQPPPTEIPDSFETAK